MNPQEVITTAQNAEKLGLIGVLLVLLGVSVYLGIFLIRKYESLIATSKEKDVERIASETRLNGTLEKLNSTIDKSTAMFDAISKANRGEIEHSRAMYSDCQDKFMSKLQAMDQRLIKLEDFIVQTKTCPLPHKKDQ